MQWLICCLFSFLWLSLCQPAFCLSGALLGLCFVQHPSCFQAPTLPAQLLMLNAFAYLLLTLQKQTAPNFIPSTEVLSV